MNSTILTLKKLSDTRWTCRNQAVEAVLNSLSATEATLCQILDGELPNRLSKTLAEARGLSSSVETFEFKIQLTFWHTVLQKTFTLFNYVQQNPNDLNTPAEFIDKCIKEIKNMPSEQGFSDIENEQLLKNAKQPCFNNINELIRPNVSMMK